MEADAVNIKGAKLKRRSHELDQQQRTTTALPCQNTDDARQPSLQQQQQKLPTDTHNTSTQRLWSSRASVTIAAGILALLTVWALTR